MSLQRRYRYFLALVLLAFLFNNSGPAPVAEAQIIPVPVFNIFSTLIGGINNLNRRNRVYAAANATANDVNAYYDELIGRMEPSEMGGQYWRIRVTLEAERQSAIKVTEIYKNDARNEFRNDMNQIAVNQIAGSKGGNNILGEVQNTLQATQLAAAAVQQAAGQVEGQTQVLDNLVAEVNSNLFLFPNLQEQMSQLGSSLGDKLNNMLGGLPDKVEEGSVELQIEMEEAITKLDEMDGFIAQIIENGRSPLSPNPGSGSTLNLLNGEGPQGIMNNTINNIMGILGALDTSGKPPANAEQIRETIRTAILEGYLQSLDQVAANASFADCELVSRDEYIAASGELGVAPEIALDEERVIYKICRYRDSGEIFYAYMIGPTALPPGIAEQDCIASPDLYRTEFANVSDEFSNQSKTVCQGNFVVKNSHSEGLSFILYHIYDNGNGEKPREGWQYSDFYLEPNESTEFYFGSQTWTDGTLPTVDTYTKLVVIHNQPECYVLVRDGQVEFLSEEFIVQLDDPCR